MKLTHEEAVDAILAAAEKKAIKAAADDDLSLAGAAAGMAAQVEQPTASVESIRALRAKNREAFAADPGGAALRLGGAVDQLLGLIGLG